MTRVRVNPLLLAVATLMAVVFHPTPAPATEGDGFAQVAGCISGAENLLISIVVDESASLQETDPTNLRVQGITAAVDSLEQLSASAPKRLNVEVSLSTFARSYRTLADWRELDERAAAQLRDVAESDLPSSNSGDATDYRQALQGAQRQLDERARQLRDATACKLLLWFTDGALDVDDQTSAAADELCEIGGLADQLRSDDITIMALALFTSGAGVTDAQRAQLQAVAEGGGPGTTCGKSPIPPGDAEGVYLPADDPDALQRLFAGAGALISGGSGGDSVQCPGAECPDGNLSLPIDSGVAGARLLVQSNEGTSLALVTPDGDRIPINRDLDQRASDATASAFVRGDLTTIDIGYEPYAMRNQHWTLEVGGEATITPYWFWGAAVEPLDDAVRAEPDASIRFQLVDQAGDPLPGSFFRSVDATMQVDGRSASVRVRRDGVITGAPKLDLENLPSSVPVAVVLRARSRSSGSPLGPISIRAELPVELPPVYPTVSPRALDFGTLEGAVERTTELTVTGSDLGPTKVCFDSSALVLPGGESDAAVSAEAECVNVPAGEQKSIVLQLTIADSLDGLAEGEVRLVLEAADDSPDAELRIPIRAELERPVSEGTRWLIVALLVLIGLLIPLALLIGSNIRLARFHLSSTSRKGTVPIRVTPSGLHPVDRGVLLDSSHLTYVSGKESGSRITVDSGIDVEARRILSLNSPVGVAVYRPGPSKVLVSSFPGYRGAQPHEAPVGLGQLDAAFVLVDSTTATPEGADGELVITVPLVDNQGLQDRLDVLSTRDWAEILREAAELGARAASEAVTDPPPAASALTAAEDDDIVERTDSRRPLIAWGDEDDGISPPPDLSPTRPERARKRDRKSPTSSPEAPPPEDDRPPLPDF